MKTGTKSDIFFDFMLSQPPELRTSEVREKLKDLGFWSKEETERAVNKHLDSQVMRYMRAMPKHDEDGNVIERIHVTRRNEDGDKEELYVQRSFLSLDDTIQAIKYRLDRRNYFEKEAIRLYEDALDRLSLKESRKLRRVFQGLLPFDDSPIQI